MKNLTRKLGMLMLILVLALCPVLMFTGCQTEGGNNDNGGVTDDANKNDNNKDNDDNDDNNDNDDGDDTPAPALTIDQAEAILKSMIIAEPNDWADTRKYVGIPNYEETEIGSGGGGATYGVGSYANRNRVVRINNNAGELQYYVETSSYGGADMTASFIKDGKYYHGSSTNVRECESKSHYYSMMLSEKNACIYVAYDGSIWDLIGFTGDTAFTPVRVSYSNVGDVYTINYIATEVHTYTNNGVTANESINYNFSISFNATTLRLTAITGGYVVTTTYVGNGVYNGQTVTDGQTESRWNRSTTTYNYNLTTPFIVPQNIIDAIPADGE